MIEQYFVTVRQGCAAVMDNATLDPAELGLKPDSPGVVKYWLGEKQTEPCKECGEYSRYLWKVKPEDITAANNLCYELNKTAAAPPENGWHRWD